MADYIQIKNGSTDVEPLTSIKLIGGKMEFSCGNETFTMKFISNNPTLLTPSVWVDFNKNTFTLYYDTGSGWVYGRSV